MSSSSFPSWGATYIEVTLPPDTEEWAEEVVCAAHDHDWTASRDDDGLRFLTKVGGNCDAVDLAASALRDLEEGLTEGNISPSEVSVRAWQPAGEREGRSPSQKEEGKS